MSKEMRNMINESKKLFVESSLSKILNHIEGDSSFGVISSDRRENTTKENKELYQKLKDKVRSMGYGYIEIDGGFLEDGHQVNEKSLFIPKIKKEEIINLGVDFAQYSVIYKDKNEFVEIGSGNNSEVGKILRNFKFKSGRKNLSINSPETKEFFSALAKGSHRGRKFLFNIEEAYLNEIIPLSFNEVAYGKKRYGKDNSKIKLL